MGTIEDNMDLVKLKEQLDTLKIKEASLLGQQQELDKQRQELVDEMKESNVTVDTIDSKISILEKEIVASEKLLKTMLSEATSSI